MITHRMDPKKIREAVGLRLREIRLEQNISLEQACKDNQLQRKDLRRIEEGRGIQLLLFPQAAAILQQKNHY